MTFRNKVSPFSGGSQEYNSMDTVGKSRRLSLAEAGVLKYTSSSAILASLAGHGERRVGSY
jgi:hypothetical protein